MNLTATLTKRELEVVEILAFTKNKEEAADKLCIATGTLCAHSFRIYEKLEINSKSELVIWWFIKNLAIDLKKIPGFVATLFICFGIFSVSEKISLKRLRDDRAVVNCYKISSK